MLLPLIASLNATNGTSWKAVEIRSFTVILAYSHILNIIRTISILGWDSGTIIIFHITQIIDCTVNRKDITMRC